MPLVRLPAQQAIEHRKTNPHSSWGDRASVNRVEPIAKPGFKVPFKIDPGSKIFTVGSCFARNVEEELERRGFELPMRKIMLQDAPTAILNNYGTPSIYNEFAWAFGEEPYVAEHHIIEVQPGKFADLHLSPTLRPEPFDRVMSRRQVITGAYRQAAECPVVIMTLGLVETWYDKTSNCYVNVAPRPSHLRSEPDRFELHVLSFEECFDYLERAIQLLRKHSKTDVRVLLTVSPVPLTITHRDEDVMVANCYSKSVLRTAAETLIAKYDFVSYYPSYESVTLSDRQRAWREDFVHVTHEIVAVNIGRMVDAFIGGSVDIDQMRVEIETGGHGVAVEKARALRVGSRDVASSFFEEFHGLSSQSPEFALEHAQFLADSGDFSGVLTVLDAAPKGMPDLQTALLKANALVEMGRAREAVDLLNAFSSRVDGPSAKKMKAATFWYALLDACEATGDEKLVLGALSKLSAANPAHIPRGNTQVGQWFQNRGEIDRAMPFFEISIAAANDPGNLAYLCLAEVLASSGKRHEARSTLLKFTPKGKGAEFRADRLMGILGEAAEAAP